MLTIDGSFGEGGGQILRTSLSLAALTGQEIRIENIRAGREKPGLRPQHLTGALAVAQICGGELEGAQVGSQTLVFRPGEVRGGVYEFDVAKIRASAGSVNLVLQTVLWPLAFADKRSRVVIKGGTHVPFAPTFDYIQRTFLPTVGRFGLKCRCEMVKAGYFPVGGGEVVLEIEPVDSLKPVSFDRLEKPVRVELVSAVSNLPSHIAQRQLKTGLAYMRRKGVQASGEAVEYPSPGKGTVFFAAAESGDVKAGFQSLGELRKPAEKVAQDACDEFGDYLGAGMALDKHLADQIIIPVALADGLSEFTTCEITQHLLTNISVVRQLLDVHFHISRGFGEPGQVKRVEP